MRFSASLDLFVFPDGYHLNGNFPTEITQLSFLRDMSLGHNEFFGTLPPELATMKHLTDVELNDNNFIGTLPAEWFRAKNLIHINVGGNGLTGTISNDIGLLTGTDWQCYFWL